MKRGRWDRYLAHGKAIQADWPAIDWFEIISENYLDTAGRPLAVLDRVAAHYPVVLHGVSMSIGSTDPLNRDYLAQLKALAARVRGICPTALASPCLSFRHGCRVGFWREP